MHKGLMALFAGNRGRGSPLAVTVEGGSATIEIYDFIVGSQVDVEWYGGGVAADTFARTLRGLDASVATVHLRINSPGGEVFAGVAMAQAIRECPANVIAHVDGYAASIASLLTVAADEAVIAPGGMVMIHKAWTFAMGNADDLIATASTLEKIDADLVDAYTAKAGDGDWAAAMASETWYRADEAVAAGLCNRIAAPAAKGAQARAFDLSAYSRPPAPDTASDDAAAAQAAAVTAETNANAIAQRVRMTRARLLARPA